MNRSASFVLVLFVCAACNSGGGPEQGFIEARVQTLTRSGDITRVTVTIPAASVTVDLTRDASDTTGSTFKGTITVPTGTWIVHAEAFAGTTKVAAGDSSQVLVSKGQTTQAALTLLDLTGPAPMPDHSPVITSLVVPANAQVGDTPPLTSAAMDADGDPITYAWTATPAGCGDFSTPTLATTNITVHVVGPCQVTITVTAKAKTDSKSATIQVVPATGTIGVVVTYVPNPNITSMQIASGTTIICSVNRITSTDATCRTPAHQGTAYTVTIAFDPMPDGSIGLQDSCNGTIVPPMFVANASSATATWTPTVSSGACILTAQLQRQTLSDQFPVVVLPAP